MKTIPQDLIRDKIYCVNYIEYLGNAGNIEHFYIAVRQDEMPKFKEVLQHGNFFPSGVEIHHSNGTNDGAVKCVAAFPNRKNLCRICEIVLRFFKDNVKGAATNDGT